MRLLRGVQCFFVFFYLLYFYYQIAENIIKISRTTGILVDPVYNIKAIRGMLTEMKNNPGRFKRKRILYIHTGTIFVLLRITHRLKSGVLDSFPNYYPTSCK